MSKSGFLDNIGVLPSAADHTRATQGREDFAAAANSLKDSSTLPQERCRDAQTLLAHPNAIRLLDTLFGNSPFLTWCAVTDPDFTLQLLQDGPDITHESILKILELRRKETLNNTDTAHLLRVARRQSALAIAVADIAGVWSLAKVTGAISAFADAALSLAATQVLRQAASEGAFELADQDQPERQSGLLILGMGKLGARELNYSSDIDLIILFNPDIVKTAQPENLQKHFVRLTRNLVKLIENRTSDGYVFRTDLRLRPDPGATPIALSTYAAETYYESLGQNWERAAMIKARPVAGDIDAGHQFLKWLTPFVWRKNLDFAAIQDIHSIKRQINAQRGNKPVDVPGHNIKLGSGGIREIEFFAQTQQLIWGGREPALRSPATVNALDALADFGLCSTGVAGEMRHSYVFLRTLEHRLQMTNDEQTQTLPENGPALSHLATFMGYRTDREFATDVRHHLHQVEGHYSRLFADAPSLGAARREGGNLMFTGGDSDPNTLKTISELGFRNPQIVDAAVRGWHHGRYRSVRSTRAREILTELMPVLLSAIGHTSDPDAAFLRFDEFLSGLPAGVQLFSMFQTHPKLLDLVAEIMGKAPRLARYLARRPSVLDAVLTPGFFEPPLDLAHMTEELAQQLDRAEHEEDLLNISRRWANDRRFQVGVQRLQGMLPAPDASRALSDVAEATLACLFPRMERIFVQQHGRIPGARMTVIALGKLGSREMTAASDLDLVFVYTAPDLSARSEGEKPLYVPQYFARFSQRYINALSATTPEGTLYEIDMRLRPSGNSGPIATTLEAFKKYQNESAWTWEHMALTRARAVAGDNDLRQEVENAIREILIRARDPDILQADVAAMRARLARERPAAGLWSLKNLRGGIIDIEFICQYLCLKYANADPHVITPNTSFALAALHDRGLLQSEDANVLLTTLDLWHDLQGMLSLTVEEELASRQESEMSEPLKISMAAIGGTRDFNNLERKIERSAKQVFDIYCRLIGDPTDG